MKRGVYSLPWLELQGYPLQGRYAALQIEQAWNEVKGHNIRGEDLKSSIVRDWRIQRDIFFATVGDMFRVLRLIKQIDIPTLLDNRMVRVALADLQRAAPNEVNIIRQDWFDRTSIEIDRMRADADTERDALLTANATADELNSARHRIDAAVEEYRTQREEEFRLRTPEWLYKRFEQGTVGTHVHAPISLYEAVAAFYDVCPAALSRGLMVIRPIDDLRIRPMSTRRHPVEIAEEEVRIEMEREAMLRMLYAADDDEVDEMLAPEYTPLD